MSHALTERCKWAGHLCVELASSEAIVEHLVPPEVVAVLVEELRDLLHVDSIVEGRGISDLTLVGRHLCVILPDDYRSCDCHYVTHLSLETLDQVTDSHTRGNGMRVNDDVRGNPLTCERHVL